MGEKIKRPRGRVAAGLPDQASQPRRVGQEARRREIRRLSGRIRKRHRERAQARRAGQEMGRPRTARATRALQVQSFQAGQARQTPARGGVRVRHDDPRRAQARQAGQVVGFPQPQAVVRPRRQGGQRGQIGPGRLGAGPRQALRGPGGPQRGLHVGTARTDQGRPRPGQSVAARADVGPVRGDPERVRAAPGIRDGQPSVVRAAPLYGQNRLLPRLPADRVRQSRPGAQMADRSRYLHRDGGRRADRRRGPAAEAARPQRRERERQAGEAHGQAKGRRKHGERRQERQAILAPPVPRPLTRLDAGETRWVWPRPWTGSILDARGPAARPRRPTLRRCTHAPHLARPPSVATLG